MHLPMQMSYSPGGHSLRKAAGIMLRALYSMQVHRTYTPKGCPGVHMLPSSRAVLCVQDTGDTRETPAIDVCKGLMADNARINIYDPKVTEAQIHNDLSLDKFMWDHPSAGGTKSPRQHSVTCFKDAYSVRPPLPARLRRPHCCLHQVASTCCCGS